jgi:hypothetical protein
MRASDETQPMAKRTRIGLSHPHLTGAYGAVMERAMRMTVPGMAALCNPDSLHVCRECAFWQETKAGKGVCRLYQRRMNGRRGDAFSGSQRACRDWASNLSKPREV